MEVRFSEEEALLRDSVLAQALKLSPTAPPDLDRYDDGDLWAGLAEAGTLGLGVDETLGGAGTALDAAIVTMALGRALAPVPYLGCGVWPAHLLALAGAAPSVVDDVVAGRRRLAVGLDPTTGALAEAGAPALAWDAAGADGALVRRDELDPADRVALFSELAEHFKGLVAFPPESIEAMPDEQYVRNVVDILFRTRAVDAKAEAREMAGVGN